MLARTSDAAMLCASSATPPWTLCAWPPVFWQANSRKQPRFVHLDTRVVSRRTAERPCVGRTVWGNVGGVEDAGLAWDWVEITHNVVAMVDPMSVVTNMQLIDTNGGILPPVRAAVYINQLVHHLPWQAVVTRLLKSG